MNHNVASSSIMHSYWPISYILQGLLNNVLITYEPFNGIVKMNYIKLMPKVEWAFRFLECIISIYAGFFFKHFSLLFTLDIDLWLNQVLSKWYQDMIYYVYVWQMRNVLLTNVLHYPDFAGQCPHPQALVLIHIEAPGWVQTVLHREYILKKDAILVH